MRDLPPSARVYVSAVMALGAALLVWLGPRATFHDPVLFGVLLVASSLTSAFKVGLPLARGGSTMSVSYAVDFASLLLLGPHETMFVAVTSAWSQCTFRMKTRNPLHRTLFSMACLAITVQAAGFAYLCAGGVPGTLATHRRRRRPAARRRRDHVFRVQHLLDCHGHRARVARQPLLRVWNENFLWSAPSYFVGAGAAAVATWAVMTSGIWLALLAIAPALPDLPHLQGLPRAHRRRAPARRGDGGPAPGHDRSAGARHRRQGSDHADAHPPRAGLRHQPGARRWA